MTSGSEDKPKLLFLTQRLPYPPNKGEKIRQYQILRHLAQFYTIYLGCLIDDPADRGHIGTIKALCSDVHTPSINRRLARLTCLTGWLTDEPLSVTFFRNASLQRWVNEIVSRVRPQVIFVISSNMAPYVLPLSHTGVCVVDLVDVDSEKWRAYANATVWPMRAVYRREWRKVAALERQIVQECDRALFVSDAEASVMAGQIPEHAARIVGVSNGVDYEYFDPGLSYGSPFDGDAPTFVFTGTMDYPPNIDAVRWFAQEVLPVIRDAIPAARFCVVGNHPAPAVLELRDIDGVMVTGWVADVRPYLAHATIAVAPMRIARGIQNKVLEAMAMACPIVVTDAALEGIEAEAGVHLLVANDPQAFAAACVRLVGPDGAALGRAARLRVIARYDWAVRLQPLIGLLDRARSLRPEVVTNGNATSDISSSDDLRLPTPAGSSNERAADGR